MMAVKSRNTNQLLSNTDGKVLVTWLRRGPELLSELAESLKGRLHLLECCETGKYFQESFVLTYFQTMMDMAMIPTAQLPTAIQNQAMFNQ